MQKARQLRRTLGANVEIVLEHDPLAVEEEALVRSGRVGEQLVDQRDEPLAEADERLIPLAIPVGVSDNVSG